MNRRAEAGRVGLTGRPGARLRVLRLAVVVCLAGGTRAQASDHATIARAERLGSQAEELASSNPGAALALAHQALDLTTEFDPTSFVPAGRKGELVEDAFLKARDGYRRHRALLYAAVGKALSRSSRHQAAARYLGRAHELDPGPHSAVELARAWLALGRGEAALRVSLSDGRWPIEGAVLEVASSAADALGLPSLQAEIDRVRLERLEVEPPVEHRHGPFDLPPEARLSSGRPFRLDQDALVLLYIADSSCRTCSADLQTLKSLSSGTSIVLSPPGPESDHALRQVARLYGCDWPVLVKSRTAAALNLPTPSVLLVSRHGWSGAVVRPPLRSGLGQAVEILGREDVQERRPRAAWTGRPRTRSAEPGPPGLLPEGLAPGEDDPPPAEFTAAVSAFRGGRFQEAIERFDAMEARSDGWLLPPEARLNRALCLDALGKRAEARSLLLRIGDSRFQEAVDRALERVGSSAR